MKICITILSSQNINDISNNFIHSCSGRALHILYLCFLLSLKIHRSKASTYGLTMLDSRM